MHANYSRIYDAKHFYFIFVKEQVIQILIELDKSTSTSTGPRKISTSRILSEDLHVPKVNSNSVSQMKTEAPSFRKEEIVSADSMREC